MILLQRKKRGYLRKLIQVGDMAKTCIMGMVAILTLAVLSSCYPDWQKKIQKRDQYFYSICPPGYACLGRNFAVNHLNHEIAVKFDAKRIRFVETKENDSAAIHLLPGGVVDFAIQPSWVTATPGPPEAPHY